MLGEIKAGRAYVEITAKDKTQQGLQTSQKSLKQMATGLRSTATLLASVFSAVSASIAISSIREFIAAGTELKTELSSIKALGPLLDAGDIERAKSLGHSLDALGEAWKRLKQQVGKHSLTKTVMDFGTGLLVGLAEDISGQGPGLGGMSFADVTTMGEDANRQASGVLAANAEKKKQADLDKQLAKDAEESGKRQAEQQKIITRGIEERQRIIQQYETDHERFLRKEQEIVMAINQLHRNIVTGFTGGEQMSGLQNALGRLRQEEQKRISAQLSKVQKEQPQQADIQVRTGSRGTFSAAGAGMLGFGTDVTVRDPENKVHTKQLIGIQKVLDERLFIPKFG